MDTQQKIADILRRAADDIMALQTPTVGMDERLFDALCEGTVFVEFEKLNGERRSMLATRTGTEWEKDFDPEAESVAVTDLGLGEVRSFRYDRVLRAYAVSKVIV